MKHGREATRGGMTLSSMIYGGVKKARFGKVSSWSNLLYWSLRPPLRPHTYTRTVDVQQAHEMLALPEVETYILKVDLQVETSVT